MKLVVIGNGFDRASALPTSYNDYFKYRFFKFKSIFLIIEELIHTKFPVTEFISMNDCINTKNISNEKYNIKYYKELKTIDKLFDEVVNKIELSEINFWDIYFWLIKSDDKNIKNLLWNKVEDEILNFLTSQVTISEFNLKNFLLFKITDFNIEFKQNFREQSFEDILYEFTIKDKIIVILRKMLRIDENAKNNDFIYTQLLEQLIGFENGFKDYINLVMSEIVFLKGNKRNQRIYKNNFLKLIEGEIQNTFFLLNFNYTSFSWSHDLNIDNKGNDILVFERNKIIHKIIETNVHGSCKKITIFGIDQSEIDAISPTYIFTKTYRKISESENLESFPLPSVDEVDEIIFYGHSLSKADYSYFQSLFDYFDIYHKKIGLAFKFSYYGDVDKYKSIKADHLRSVTNLIKSYGKSMDNDKLGNNLIHKLLLEKRLSTQNIVLEHIPINEFINNFLQ